MSRDGDLRIRSRKKAVRLTGEGEVRGRTREFFGNVGHIGRQRD